MARHLPLVALGAVLAVSCSVPSTPVPVAFWTAQSLAWASDDTLYFQARGSARSAVFRWQTRGDATIVPALASVTPIAGRDGDLLVRDDATGQFRIFSPGQAQWTILPLDPKTAQALGWDRAGRMLVRRVDGDCNWAIHAVATGSDAGTVVSTNTDATAMSPGRDALMDRSGGIRVLPLFPGAVAGVVTNASEFHWLGPRELAVPSPGYRYPKTWLSVDLSTGQTRPLANEPDMDYALSPDGRWAASVTTASPTAAIVIRESATGRTQHTIDLKTLPAN